MARHNGSQEPDADPVRYLVEFTEPALAEADAAYLWLSEHSSLDYAIRWYEGLFVAAQGLSFLPRSQAIAPENDRYDVEVRRLLYYGPSRRRTGTVYRILFYIIEPQKTTMRVSSASCTFGTAQKARFGNPQLMCQLLCRLRPLAL